MITVDEFKYWAGIKPANPEQDELDSFIQDCIDEAVGEAENLCNQKLTYGKRTKYIDLGKPNQEPNRLIFDRYPNKNIAMNTVRLCFPIDTIIKIQYLDKSTGYVDIIAEESINDYTIINQEKGILTLLKGNYFKPCTNKIEYYHGYKDTFVSKAITAIESGSNELGATAILTVGSHTRNVGDVVTISGIVNFQNNPKGKYKIIAVDSDAVIIQFNLGTGEYTSGGTIEYNVSDVLSVPPHLKKCIKYIATQIYNNSEQRVSRFGLSSKNMNASGSSGQTYRSDKEFYEYIDTELQPYKFFNI